jgi:transposase
MASIRRKLPEDLEQRMRNLLGQCRNNKETRRVQVILLLAQHRWGYEQIAKSTGYAPTTVRDIQTRFFREGESALINRKKHRERHQYMKREQEREFLEGFAQSALEGELVSVADIQQAYEQQIGRKVYTSTIYGLLHRHGWRKVAPRPRHPNADAQQREHFKKTPEIAKQTAPQSQSQWIPSAGDVSG